MVAAHTKVWQAATVQQTLDVADGIRRIVLRPRTPTRIDPGAHVDVMIDSPAGELERSYSIVEPVGESGDFAISVHQSAVSRGGAIAMHALRAGDTLAVTAPLQDFPFLRGARRFAFLAGGVGITAILGMARRARLLGETYTLDYCGRTRSAMAYLEAVSSEHADNLSLHVGDEGTSLEVDAWVDALEDGTELYMCGPIRLMDAVRRSWVENGRSIADLRYETFGNSGWAAPESFVVRVPSLGAECVVGSSQTLLEALESAGVDAMFDCRKGECGLCEARVLQLEGDIDHRDVFYSERQRQSRSKICVCVSRVHANGGAGSVDLQLT